MTKDRTSLKSQIITYSSDDKKTQRRFLKMKKEDCPNSGNNEVEKRLNKFNWVLGYRHKVSQEASEASLWV